MAAVSQLPVYVAHVPGRIHPLVREYLEAECPDWIGVETPESDPFSEQSAVRRVWREHTGFIWLEQSSMPPPGCIAEYDSCAAEYCQRPHAGHGNPMVGAWACWKVSASLTRRHPDLADRVLAGRNPLEWWKLGLLVNRPYEPGWAPPPGLKDACLDPERVRGFGDFPGPLWPTTARRPYGDVQLHWAIEKTGTKCHVHAAESVCFPHTNDDERAVEGFRWYA